MNSWSRRKHSKGTSLHFESLENRRLLAADLVATDLVAADLGGECEQVATAKMVAAAATDTEKPRLIVLTDIGSPDPDDEQSMVRLLTYANDFQIEGLIAGSVLQGQRETGVHLIRNIIDVYEQVQPNLVQHDPNYPTADYLRARTVEGQSRQNFFGDDFDTAGSELIIQAVDAPDSRPVNISIWGGSVDLAQALWKVRRERTAEELSNFISKIRVAWIEQDSSVGWITSNFPELWVVSNLVDGNGFVHSPFRGMYLGGDTTTTSIGWVSSNVKSHQPWGDVYPLVADGGEMKEGDTPTWFYFLENGLNSPENPDFGGWGGRYEADGPIHSPQRDHGANGPEGRNTVNRWRDDFQNDFAARMAWSTQSVADANHNPIAVIDVPNEISAIQGESIEIDASQSTDPDGDSLSFEWLQYVEAGSYPTLVGIDGTDTPIVRFTAPEVTEPETVHLILRVRDDSAQPMVAYQRVVLTVNPHDRTDLNRDGEVGFTDFLILASNFGATDVEPTDGDLDEDQQVTFGDFLIYSANSETPDSTVAEQEIVAEGPDPLSQDQLFTTFLVLSGNFGQPIAGGINGDLNEDGIVDFPDFLTLLGAFPKPEPKPDEPFTEFLVLSSNFGRKNAGANEGDLDGDGTVGFSDFLIHSRRY